MLSLSHSVLFAENYTETHYLLDGSAVTNTRNHTVSS